jgi:hypothetical protein
MSVLEINSSVQFIIENHHLLTDEHMDMLDKLWHLKYEMAAEPQAQLQAEPKKPRPDYNHPRWPSPLPKVFVQYIRGNNAWNYSYPGKTAWTSDFKAEWQLAGNTEFKLNHENCIRYLAYRMALTPEKFLEMTPRQVKDKLSSYIPETFIRNLPYWRW